MSITSNKIHERIEWLVAQANDFLPDDVHLGYALCHTHHGDESVVADNDIITAENELKDMMLKELGKRSEKGWAGADDDAAALPSKAASIGDVDVIFDLFHIPTGTSVVRTYRLLTLRNLATNDQLTNEQKRQTVKTQLQSFYSDLQARLP